MIPSTPDNFVMWVAAASRGDACLARTGPPIAIDRDWGPSSELADGVGAQVEAIGKLRLPLPPGPGLQYEELSHNRYDPAGGRIPVFRHRPQEMTEPGGK